LTNFTQKKKLRPTGIKENQHVILHSFEGMIKNEAGSNSWPDFF
jgi:hypothetical protein